MNKPVRISPDLGIYFRFLSSQESVDESTFYAAPSLPNEKMNCHTHHTRKMASLLCVKVLLIVRFSCVALKLQKFAQISFIIPDDLF